MIYTEGGITIRPAAPEDAAGIAAMQATHFPNYAAPSLSRVPNLRASIRDAASEGSTFHVVTGRDGELIGFAFGKAFPATRHDGVTIPHRHGAVGVLAQVAVEPTERGNGFGRTLVAAALDDMHDAGYSIVQAHIPGTLQGWYEALGWNVFPSGHGFTWLEVPGEGSAQLAPADWPEQDRRVDTPRFAVLPDGHGYDQLAVIRFTDGNKLIATSSFAPLNGHPVQFPAARALLTMFAKDPRGKEAFQNLPTRTQVGLVLDGATAHEQATWPDGLDEIPGNPAPHPRETRRD
jgi:predicted N-acetyltransferase YhbS